MTERQIARVEIHDRTEKGFLAFDLQEILSALLPWLEHAVWDVSEFEGLPKKDGDPQLYHLERTIETSGSVRMTTANLLRVAEAAKQVINGKFVAYRQKETEPTLTVQAFDSSFWAVDASEVSILETIKARFASTRIVPPSE